MNSESDELDLMWEQEKIRRRKSYSYIMSEVFIKGYEQECSQINEGKINEWAKKFREITDL